MNFVVLVLAIGVVSVSARKYGNEYGFESGKPMSNQPSYMPSPNWNYPSSSSQPSYWQSQPPFSGPNQPTMMWPSQPSMNVPNRPMNWPSQPSMNMVYPPMNWPNQPQTNMPNRPMNWPNQPLNIPENFGQGNQMPYGPRPQPNMNGQLPQKMPGFFPPSYGGNFPNPQMNLYRTKKNEKTE